MKAHEERRDSCRGRSWPEVTVTDTWTARVCPKVTGVKLSCGHTTVRARRPKIGATVVCDQCAKR